MEKQNRFIVISTVYNKGKWIEYNVNSVKQQNYGNWVALYGYDKSTDFTLNYLTKATEDDTRTLIYHNPNPGCFLNCFMGTYNHYRSTGLIQDDDIIVEIDGDDWLMHPFVFSYLNEVYQNENIWMTYGQYVHYTDGSVGGHYHMHLDNQVDELNAYRQATFPYSHLKTFKAFLINNITYEDLTDPTTGKYFNAAADFALSMPLVEQAGKSRIFRVPDPLYIYNNSSEVESETNNRLGLQKEVEQRIRQIKPKQKL